jgi:hypothetical protein
LHLPGSSPEKKTTAARRRRSPATISGELGSGETADGELRATVIPVVVFVGSPASRFGGNRRMEAATVCRLRRAIALYCGSARGKEKVRGCGRSMGRGWGKRDCREVLYDLDFELEPSSNGGGGTELRREIRRSWDNIF